MSTMVTNYLVEMYVDQDTEVWRRC